MKKADDTKSGVIFNIQKYSVNDGPGIRTVVFLKGCPLRCRWCANPESQLSKVQILWDNKKCRHCQHCISVCPQSAISLSDGRMQIDPNKCSGCKACTEECPSRALEAEGETKMVREILDVVMQDEVFYEESKGGITLSGGEILAQPGFAAELLAAAKEKGLHTCCETTGFANTEVFDYVTKQADLLLFDLKHWNGEKHREGTGVDRTLPYENLKRAIEKGKEVLPRIPVIPGYNDSLTDAAEFARILCEAGAQRCQLLPFHQFGENKYHLLNRNYAYEDLPSLHREDLSEYLQVFLERGIDAFF